MCRRFTVESGHMLSQHPERCRFPHGHTRTIEVVVTSDRLDANGMVVDFKALKLALESVIDKLDHSLAVNSSDPRIGPLLSQFGEGLLLFENEEPTTEAMARRLFEQIACILMEGYASPEEGGPHYRIPPGGVRLERVRVWETPSCWAEYGI